MIEPVEKSLFDVPPTRRPVPSDLISWHVTDGHNLLGPLGMEDVLHALECGKIDSRSWVWSRGWSSWERLDECAAFRAALRTHFFRVTEAAYRLCVSSTLKAGVESKKEVNETPAASETHEKTARPEPDMTGGAVAVGMPSRPFSLRVSGRIPPMPSSPTHTFDAVETTKESHRRRRAFASSISSVRSSSLRIHFLRQWAILGAIVLAVTGGLFLMDRAGLWNSSKGAGQPSGKEATRPVVFTMTGALEGEEVEALYMREGAAAFGPGARLVIRNAQLRQVITDHPRYAEFVFRSGNEEVAIAFSEETGAIVTPLNHTRVGESYHLLCETFDYRTYGGARLLRLLVVEDMSGVKTGTPTIQGACASPQALEVVFWGKGPGERL